MSNLKVRDKFWLFASKAHDDDRYFGRILDGGLAGTDWSRITPAEGAFMLGVPNLMMIISGGVPAPYTRDSQGYLESFIRLKKVLWSCSGAGGFRFGNEEDYICDMVEKYPNIAGGFFDDVTWDRSIQDYRSPENVKKLFQNVRRKFDTAGKDMEIWATCYVDEMAGYPADTYDDVDVMTIWSMHQRTKEEYVADFEKYEKEFPNKRKAMGIYMYDYINAYFYDLDYFKMQCETSLQWLKDGRLDGIVFLTNCTMGIRLETELWLSDWIDKVGDEEL